jgi:hypothetical protein
MPGSASLPRGNIAVAMILQTTLTPAQVTANTTAEQTFTVNGLLPTDLVSVTKPTTQAGLGIVNSRVSAANTLAITFVNATAGNLTPTAGEIYIIELNRAENAANLPTAVV